MNLDRFRSFRLLKYRVRECIAYIYSVLGQYNDDQLRVVIFAQGRTGSTLLESLIGSSGHFRTNGEILRVSKGEIFHPYAFINGLAKWKHHTHFIFHLKIIHLTKERKHPVDPQQFIRKLHSENWQIIYLRRRNKIRQAISNIIAEHRGQYHKFDDSDEVIRLHIDCRDFVQKVKARIQLDRMEHDILEPLEYYELVYEDDLRDSSKHQQSLNGIFDHFGLERTEVQTSYRKVNPYSLKKIIINYDEFLQCIKNNGWEHYLESDLVDE